ncbi:MAG: pyridoxamine 5'-phosphate oxidase family protein [Bacteroidales bacterium]
MNPIDKRIIRFLHKHHVFTLATCSNNKPYTCSCFYVYMEEHNCIIFTSGSGTRHVSELETQPQVAGAIALETMIVGSIQGIQFTGDCYLLQGAFLAKAKEAYHKHFPVSLLMDLTLWGITPDFIKMTHNSLGFGNKLVWENRKNQQKNTY